ncbi:beta-L-arabinofuranosidase domain-containing protein, partial [Nitrosopumilus sp. Nsub]|uniref:beta-L-arabinofuranosidase domain-containing protein n=1 Tax=Nitrosopumilus sp. Nsub TaxID=1776294 RepID=UPI000A5C882D
DLRPCANPMSPTPPPMYGLAPNYGCCTANFNQGWPKFTEHLVMEAAGGRGLVIPMYAPVSVKHKLSNGGEVVMDIKTDYPFSDTIMIDINCGKDIMLLLLMIPSWADNPTVGINGGKPNNALPGRSKVN